MSGNSIRKYSTDENPLHMNLKIHKTTKQDIKIDDCISEMNANIPLSNVKKLFNIKVHQLRLKDNLLKQHDIKYTDDNMLALELDLQLFCGSECISSIQKILWKGIKTDVNALIRNHLSFNIKYCDLPLFSSIIFKIKAHIKIPKEKKKKEEKLFEKKTIAWVSFRLFDHLKRLKSGIKKEI
jgi:hypothetical protein